MTEWLILIYTAVVACSGGLVCGFFLCRALDRARAETKAPHEALEQVFELHPITRTRHRGRVRVRNILPEPDFETGEWGWKDV